jgi:hypothetical protein
MTSRGPAKLNNVSKISFFRSAAAKILMVAVITAVVYAELVPKIKPR